MTDNIDPREFGALEAKVESLSAEVHALSSDVKELLALANKSKGGFWMGMVMASVVGSAATLLVEWTRK